MKAPIDGGADDKDVGVRGQAPPKNVGAITIGTGLARVRHVEDERFNIRRCRMSSDRPY